MIFVEFSTSTLTQSEFELSHITNVSTEDSKQRLVMCGLGFKALGRPKPRRLSCQRQRRALGAMVRPIIFILFYPMTNPRITARVTRLPMPLRAGLSQWVQDQTLAHSARYFILFYV